ncbi:MAG: hypothetical protein CM1200mP10_11000 [Candidatus Neomarinimicrobiota bacterium]|nr:MAG: hypothetical protein CM1200mP10_11000 [Candidatus Neomarinimicrobiota bacterium]
MRPGDNTQKVAKKMEPAGIGTLYLAFEALKKQLAAEGLFDPEVKQKLPVNPSCIGVITSQTGAAGFVMSSRYWTEKHLTLI